MSTKVMVSVEIENAANAAYAALSFGPEPTAVTGLVLEDTKRIGGFHAIVPTELYVYEELAFVIETARQAQMLCGFLDTLLRLESLKQGREVKKEADAVMDALIMRGPLIAHRIVQEFGLPVTKSESWIENLVSERVKVYSYYFNECFRSHGEPPHKVARAMREAPRNHSIMGYHDAVASYFSDSLNSKSQDSAERIYIPLVNIGARYHELHASILTLCDDNR